MKKFYATFFLSTALLSFCFGQTVTIGAGTTSSYFYGPYYRSSATSTFNYSMYAYLYSATELSAIPAGSIITMIEWEHVSGTLTGNNDFTIMLANNGATSLALGETWGNLTTGATTVYSSNTQEFINAGGWESFTLTTPFIYNGGSLQIMTDHAKFGTASAANNFNYETVNGMAVGYASGTQGTASTVLGSTSYANRRPNIRITYTAGTPCAGTPSPGFTLAGDTTLCVGESTSLSLENLTSGSGVSYQWYSSSDGITYTPLLNDTMSVLNVSQGPDTYYYCDVTCSGSTGSSTPIMIGSAPAIECYCIPNSGTGCGVGDLIASVELNTLVNITGTACISDYNDFTTNPALTTTLLPSSTYSCIIGTGNYAQGYAAWIDYNDDGLFDLTERIGYTTTDIPSNSTASFPITLSCTPPSGQHRLRVRSAWATGGINITPCGTQSYGEVEDYLITIGDPPACPSPGSVTLVTPTVNSADIEFSLGCSSATNFDIEYGISGFNQGDGTTLINEPVTVSGSSASFSLDGLTENTVYDFYFRANCGGDSSGWIGPNSFQTLCSSFDALAWCESFDSTSTTEACWTILNNNGDTDSWTMDGTLAVLNGDNSAQINTDFNSGNNDDWLISPNLVLTGNEILTFNYRVYSAGEPNDFEVLLSTTGINPSDFTDTLMSLDSYSNVEYQDSSLNLSEYNGPVYIAFHIPPGGLDGWYLMLDQICVDICTPTPSTDGDGDVCRLDEVVDLNTIITPGQSNGVWSFDANPSVLNGSEVTVTGLPNGLYQAMYVVTTACTADTAYANFEVFGASLAGEGGTLNVCRNEPFNLLNALTGTVDLGGTWYDPNNVALPGSQDVASNFPGNFNYDYVVSNGVCPYDTANVLVIVDGSCDYLSLEELSDGNWKLYPNPTQSQLFIEVDGISGSYDLTIQDIDGKTIQSLNKTIDQNGLYEISLDQFVTGVYFVTISNELGRKSFRVVKQ